MRKRNGESACTGKNAKKGDAPRRSSESGAGRRHLSDLIKILLFLGVPSARLTFRYRHNWYESSVSCLTPRLPQNKQRDGEECSAV